MVTMKYNDAIDYLYALQKYGIKFGLDNTVRLLSLLGNPQDSFRSVHVAGTNGKGSTSAMIASVLRAAGFSVGLFTSPHMVSFTERIRVNGIDIEEKEVVGLTEEIRDAIEKGQKVAPPLYPQRAGEFSPTFFEFVTAMGFLYFRRKGVAWAVVETGMGGRLDATNVLLPEVSVITNISYDHSEFLGATLEEIAGEKAGIIKRRIPVVSSCQEPVAAEVIRRKAGEKEARLFLAGEDFLSRPVDAGTSGVSFDYEGKASVRGLHVPLPGVHQVENASLAVKSIEVIMEKEALSFDHVREGLGSVRWPGRLELMRNEGCGYDFLIDGAHNPSAAKALAHALERYFMPSYERLIVILGIMGDKDLEGIMKPLLGAETILTAPAYERAASPEALALRARALGFRPEVKGSVRAAIEAAKEKAGEGPGKTLIVITGSFYTIGEAKEYFGEESASPSLARLR